MWYALAGLADRKMGNNLKKLSRLIRYFILTSSSEAGSGHPTSSLSATDLMNVLMFGGFFRFDIKNPLSTTNDRLIFSKGHASPLFYSLWAAAGAIEEKELLTFRKFGSRLEGHPTMEFPYTESATGSLGQGLSIGVGMALNSKYIDKSDIKIFVLLGDSEMAEGSIWEAIQIASFYKLDNLVGIVDVNRLGQRGETMYGHNVSSYQKRIASFGWETFVLDGHNLGEIKKTYQKALKQKDKPVMIIAKTIKGKGVSFLEDQENWHGKTLSKEELEKALKELGGVEKSIRGEIAKPKKAQENLHIKNKSADLKLEDFQYDKQKDVATRKAYGNALIRIFPKFSNMVVLDAEVSNSTYAEIFKSKYPQNFFEMFIAEQNMVGIATGFARLGKIPFVSTFAAFFSRAFDQIRMSQYSRSNIKFIGSHSGVSIGEDGASQMGLEDLAMFRNLIGSVVLYPSDAICCERLVEEAAKHEGIVYIRTTRKETPILYSEKDKFKIGGSVVLRKNKKDLLTVVSAGITLYQALDAYEKLKEQGKLIRIVDLYSIKPLDIKTLTKAAKQTGAILTVEDHHLEGGIGEAVSSALSTLGTKVYSLAVKKIPRSGKPQQLLDYEEISTDAIIKKVKKILADRGLGHR